MWYRLALIGVLVGVIGGGAAGVAEAKQGQAPPEGAAKSAAAEKAGVIEPKADAALHRMSDYLSGLNTFRVDTSTVDETKVNKDGQKIQQLADSKFAVRRPGEMRIDRVSPNGRVVFRDDGKQFSVYNSDKNIYATAPAPGKLDQAADDARKQLQVDAPGVDLLASNPYVRGADGRSHGGSLHRARADGRRRDGAPPGRDQEERQLSDLDPGRATGGAAALRGRG